MSHSKLESIETAAEVPPLASPEYLWEEIKLAFHNVVHPKSDQPETCAKKERGMASSLRLRANRIFVRCPAVSLMLFTKAIAYCPFRDMLAVVHAERAFLLFHICKYQECMTDVRQAKKYEYPDLDHKLYKIERQCLKRLKQKTSPAVNTEAENLVNDRITVNHSNDLSCHLQANTTVNPGEVLLTEDPFASVLWREHFATHCYSCLIRSSTLIPCHHCCLAMFCSKACRTSAWSRYHRLECSLLPVLLDIGMDNNTLLALRVLLVVISACGGLGNFYAADCQNYPDSQYQGEAACQNLRRLIDQVYFDSNVNQYAMLSALIISLLEEHSSVLSYDLWASGNVEFANRIPDLRMFAGLILMKLLQNLGLKTAIVKDVVSRIGQRHSRIVDVGSAVYMAASLMYHCHKPNATGRFQSGHTYAVVAVNFIQKGDRLTLPRHDRFLQTEENVAANARAWLIGSDISMEGIWFAYKCSKCLCPLWDSPCCANCRHTLNVDLVDCNIKHCVTVFVNILDELGHNKWRASHCADLARVLTLLERCVSEPCPLITECRRYLAACFTRHGNFYTRI